MKFTDLPPDKGHHVIVFGPPKSGKTLLLGKLAVKKKLHVFDMERGSTVFRQLPRNYQENIDVFRLPDTRSLPIAIHTCMKTVRGGVFNICDTHGAIDCRVCKDAEATFSVFDSTSFGPDDITVYDSLTQFTNSGTSWIGRNEGDDFKFGYDEWANLGRLMDRFLSEVQASPLNICCISHETETEMEDGSKKLVPTAGTSRFSRNTAKYFDEVIYTEVKNGKHVIGSSTLYSGCILSGSRSGAVLEKYPDPIDALLAIFDGVEMPPLPMNTDTPAHAAMSSLKKLTLKKG